MKVLLTEKRQNTKEKHLPNGGEVAGKAVQPLNSPVEGILGFGSKNRERERGSSPVELLAAAEKITSEGGWSPEVLECRRNALGSLRSKGKPSKDGFRQWFLSAVPTQASGRIEQSPEARGACCNRLPKLLSCRRRLGKTMARSILDRREHPPQQSPMQEGTRERSGSSQGPPENVQLTGKEEYAALGLRFGASRDRPEKQRGWRVLRNRLHA